MKLKTLTLGCKVNQYETEWVRQSLHTAGYLDAGEDEQADLCIVNTCTVTHEGDAKSRQVIRRLARENPSARIVVTGCYATRAPKEVAALPQVAEVVTDKRELPDLLGRFGVVDVPTGISTYAHRTRAYVKVQDGCLLRCSYCIIPHVRPNVSSRPVPEIVDEVKRLTDNGFREVILTGIHLGHYGVESNWNKPKEAWTRLSHLLEALVKLSGQFRIRLSSIEATEVTRELIGVMADYPDRICPHLHLCLQSGSDRILRAMRRRWSSKMYLSRCELVREKLDNPAITTDVIVGFPGETEDDFAATLNACREAGFCKIHAFPFSARRGTPAATMTDQIQPEVKKARCIQVAGVDRELQANYYRSLVGRALTGVVEYPSEANSGSLLANSCRFAPVEIRANDKTLCGKMISVTPTRAVEGKLIAEAFAVI
jgi:threonylcarbamoyladenosine tRNA methylthiotransferase MtaB